MNVDLNKYFSLVEAIKDARAALFSDPESDATDYVVVHRQEKVRHVDSGECCNPIRISKGDNRPSGFFAAKIVVSHWGH